MPMRSIVWWGGRAVIMLLYPLEILGGGR
jgi:hypothetical protein